MNIADNIILVKLLVQNILIVLMKKIKLITAATSPSLEV